ncbi:MAG: helix-turn-helix domain-containing protein [Tissierellia bacterium]|nr:helix-turn-helix domain-containing protein [Tissierellia bacterium]
MEIGNKIKNLRLTQGLTQEELANRSELTKGFISMVERDLTSPSITTLSDLLEALGSNLKDFFSEDGDNRLVFSEDDQYVSTNEELGYDMTWVVPNAQKNAMEPVLIDLFSGGKTMELPPEEGEFFGYVLNGTVIFHLGDEQWKVNSGDSFYYRAKDKHFLENISKKNSRVIWVCNPPLF